MKSGIPLDRSRRQSVPRHSICCRTRCQCESGVHSQHDARHMLKPMLSDKPDITCPTDVAESEQRQEVVRHEDAPGEVRLKKNSGDKKATFTIKAKSIPVTPKTVAATTGPTLE